MQRVKFGLTSGVSKLFGAIFCAVIPLVFVATAPAQPTNLAVTVRHAPSLNGNGRIEGSLQQLLGENATLNGGFTMTGDLLVPGTPTLRVNGKPTFAGTIAGTGGTSPTGYQITLNGNCSLRYLRTRTTPVSLPTVTAPPQPAGTRSVTINNTGQSIGDPATLRNLTLNGNVGQVTVPPGTYGTFTVNGGSGLVLGVAGGFQAVNYNLQNLNLNGCSTLKVVGPVVLTVANGFTANGTVGASNNPAWFQLQIASGGFTLNGGCTVYGLVLAPNGTVIVNGNSTLVGTSASDQFILNGGGVVRWGGSSTQTNPPPVATAQSITLAENSSTNITLTGSDPQGRTLTFSLLTLPTHGTVSGTPPGVTYQPATNYFGSDAFTFKVNNGITDSSPATVSLTVTQVYYPPTAFSQSLTNFEDTVLPVTLTGYDPQGYALTFSVLTQPAHGTLSGTVPNLTYKPATNYFGNDSFTFRVSDGVSNSLAATISITNRPVDDPPLVVAGPDQLIILPANSVNLAGSVTYDVFPGTVDTVVWSKVSGPGNVTFSNPSNTLTTATFSQSGIYRLRLFASDSFLSGSNDLFVTVDAPPVVNAGQTMTNTFPGIVTLSGTVSDDGLPTNGTLTVVWSKISGPGTVVFGNAATTNSAATFSTNGVYVLRLTADDGIATNHSEVTVIENLPPVVNAGANILTNGLHAALNGIVTDDGLPGSFLSAQWSQSTGPGTVTFVNTSATNTTVTASQSGTYVLVLSASDGAATNSSEVVVTFNLPPVVNAGPDQTVNFGTTVTLAGTVTDDQLPHNILTSIWTEVSGPGTVTFDNASSTNTTATFSTNGVYVLKLTASDGASTNSSNVTAIVNQAPTVSVTADKLTVEMPGTVTLNGIVYDDGLPNGTLTCLWNQAGGPGTATFSNPAGTNITVSFNAAGTYILSLTANDSVATGSNHIILTVLPTNQPPVANSQTLTVAEDTALKITLTGSDPEGASLTYTLLSQPAHGTLNPQPLTLNKYIYTPATDYNGPDSFTFKVNDGRLDSAPATVAINVQAVTNALQLNVPGDQETPQNAPLAFEGERQITIRGSKAGSGTLTLSLSVTNGTLTLGSPNGLIVISGADGTSSLTVSGSQNDLNTALDGLTYLGNPCFVGTDAIVLVVEDSGSSGSMDSKVVPITVLPSLTYVSPFTGAVQAAPFVITYDALHWNSDIGCGVSFKVESLTSGTLTKDGQPLEYGTSLVSPSESVVWTPPSDAIGQVEAFRVVAWDGTHQSSNSVPVYVQVHAPMHLNVPGEQTIPHNMLLLFGPSRLISITDEDAGLGELELSLSVSNGTLTLGSDYGLDWQAGANGTSTLVVRGYLGDLNANLAGLYADLAGLRYHNSSGFSGADLLSVTVDDLGNNDLGINFKDAKTIPITVIAPPNNPPKVSIVAPADTSQFQFGQTFAVEATATDGDGQVNHVTLMADGLELAELAAPPFATAWTNATLGRHVLSAVATDNQGVASISSGISIWVVDENGDFLVEAGSDQIISLPNTAFLAGTVEIQTPVTDSQTNVTWSKLDGPGDVQFSDPNALSASVQFSEPGSYTLKLQVACAGGTRSDLLKVDVLPAPPDRLTAARSNRGTDFWLTFLSNDYTYAEPRYSGFDLYISADVDTVGKVDFFDGNLEQRFQVRAGSTTIVPARKSFFNASDFIQTKAIHVTTDHPVTVHGLDYIDYATDGYLALPTVMLGTDYIVLSYRNSPIWFNTNHTYGGTQFTVVASDNDTTITITPSVTVHPGIAGLPPQIVQDLGATYVGVVDSRIVGVPYQIVLQQGETYSLINYDNMEADLTGTTITADKPIAVFGVHTFGFVPAGIASANHLVEQLTPVNTWGRHFATMPLAARLNGDTFRFLAATNGTRVAINGKIVASLDRGQFYEQIIDGPAEILASQPILVAQYANGTEYDGSLGDPSMTLVPSVEQFGGNCTLSTPSFWYGPDGQTEDIFTDYLNLIIRTNGVGLIQLDGVCVPASQFQIINNSGYAGAQLPLDPGTHHLSAPIPFGACVYGWAWADAYSFWCGIYSETVESDTKLELTQTTPFAAVGSEKTVIAYVTNGRGLPIPDMEVNFSVSGANVVTGKATTSRLGQAVFSYSGTNAGVDMITATLVDLEQSVTNTWVADSDNAPPVVSTAGTPPLQFSRTIELIGLATDDGRPEGGSLHVQWKLINGPAEVQFENATQSVTHAVCPLSGAYEFELSADDTQFSSRDLVEVTVDDLPGIGFPRAYTGIPSLAPVGSPIQLMADAWDDDGEIDRIEFYANDGLIGTATNWDWGTGYSINWTPSTNGWFQIHAVAFDNLGGSNSLDIGTVQVSYPPQVSIDSPGNGAVLTVPTNVFVHATANDPDGSIVSVSIYANGGLLGTSDGPDVAATWFPRQEGDYTLTAIATDDLGLTTSENVSVTVTGDFPHVALIHNTTNAYGSYIAVFIGVPTCLAADVWMPGPHHITNVTFYVTGFMGGQSGTVVSLSEPPYQILWTDQDAGFYSITVIAEADSGAIGETLEWVSSYRKVSIAFAAPAANKPVAVGMPVAIQLSVDDPGHILETFDYYVNGQLLIETTNSDAVLWQPPSPGNYQLSARAIDRIYGTRGPFNTETLSVNANFAFINDGVAIVSPNDGDSLYVGSPAPICLAFEDATGDFDHAKIFTNGVSLGQTTNTCFEWVPQQTNDYSLTAVAFDHQGNASAPSEPVLVHVLTPPPPEIVITSPKNGDRLALGQETIVAVDVNDPAQAVTNLELVVDGVEVADSLDSYILWTPNSIGSHTLAVVAADWNGNQVASAPVNVSVVEMHPPTVMVTSPADGIHFTAETLPPLVAAASDSDGIVTNLTLELDGVVLGATNGTALELSATNILGGWHSVLARATDNDGLTTASTTVSFFIERSEDASLPVPDQFIAETVSATEIRLNWQPLPTNTPASSVLVERWNTDLSAWIEIGKVSIGETSYANPGLSPETSYRYRAAITDDKVHRSAYSAEARATTRTVVPNYSVIDLTEALIASLTGRGAGANILTNSGLTHFDSRRTVPLDAGHADSVLGTNATALKLAVARFKERWPQIQLDYDPILLSPKSVMPRLGYLPGPGGAGVTVSEATAQMFDPDDPDRPVKAFLQEYQVLFGFGPEALDDANVQHDYVSAGNGARTVVWQQQVAGVPVFDALLIGHITQAGELVCLSSEFIPSPAQAADPAMLAAVQSGADLPLPVQQALVTAVTNIGDRFTAGYVVAETDAAGVTRQQTFTATDGIKGDARAELTWFPASRTQLKLCWQVLFTSQWRDEMYLSLVSADTGEILYRRDLTTEGSAITCRVYTNASPAPLLPGWPTPNTTQPAPVERGLVTFTALDDIASPNGWINDGDNETRGNNVDAHLDRNDDNLADLPRPTGNPSRVFDFPLDLTTAPANYGDAATVQLFYWDNWMHDALYQFGFTEAAGNFQTDNFGRGGLGNDAVQADAQDGLGLNDGRHANNANMSTPPDGCAPRMQMYVFDGASPARDGSLDAQIVLHEYTHGLSARLVGGGAGIDALQTAGMGEGWSDFYALALLTDSAADVDGVYPMASYVAYHGFGTTFEENYYYGIRRYPYCTDTNKNPLTFADIDPWKAIAHDGVPRNPLLGPFRADLANEVHSQGEVWCMMLWEMRANLIRKLGPEAGNNLALQLVTDGLKLSPPNPNFVQARDAILLADRMWSGGANAPEIWSAFAKRGLGFNAKAPESYTTTGAQESHDLMPALATERVEIQGGSGSVELGVNNNLLIHLRNQGDTAATHVSGRLATAVPGVTVLQNLSTYSDIPQGGSRANDAVFQIQTGTGFVEGTPIDLAFVITSDQSAGTNYLRLFTGVPGAEILFDNYSALADPATDSSVTKDLTPMDLGNLEPLWMADDASCLLKAGAGKYVLWKPDGTSLPIVNANFLAHRLTRNGVVVGTLTVTNRLDEWTNKITGSVGAWWFFLLNKAVPLTQDEYRWPKNAAPLSPAGMAYSLTNLINGQPQFLTNVTIYPTLQDVWDMNSNGVAVGSVSVQEPFSWQQILFGGDGTMNWFKPSERGLDAGESINSVTELKYYALLSTAAQFNNINDWRWLGPLSWGYSTAIALLVNDAGMVAGYGGVYTGSPTFDALRPTHAFRAPASGEFDGSAIILTNDLGVLPGGLHSFPRAMNQAGELAGYSDFDVMNTGGLTFDPINSHAVFWGLTNQTPEYLTNLPPGLRAPNGYGDAYAINDSNQIVGASMTVDDRLVAALWQLNHNTNSAPFWEITDLNDRLTDPSLQVFRAVGINNDGLILAYAQNAAGENHAVLLIPMAMAVDNNRDGQITFDAADQATADKPYHFWINDSQESGDISSAANDIPGSNHPNHNGDHANGRSDLVNFFPVALNLSNVLRFLPPMNGYEYHLSQADGAVKFIYTALERTNAFDYLTNLDNYVYGNYFNERAITAYAIPVPATPEGKTLNTTFLDLILADGNKGVILVEGTKATQKPLMLEIWHKGQKLAGIPLYLNISPMEDMYRHLNLRDGSDAPPASPNPNGLVGQTSPGDWTRASQMAERPAFPDSLSNGKWLVFIPGYNVSGQEARGWESEMFKRFYWSHNQARFVGVAWFGNPYGGDDDYLADYHWAVMNAFATAPKFAEKIGALSGPKTIVSHSLGGCVVSSAIQDYGLVVDNFCMVDGSIAMEAFQGDMSPDLHNLAITPWVDADGSSNPNYSSSLWASEWHSLFPASDHHSGLTWRDRFVNAVPVIHNFYSSTENVLAPYVGTPPSTIISILLSHPGMVTGRYAWEVQEKTKGRKLNLGVIEHVRGGSDYGGWGFNIHDGYLTNYPIWYKVVNGIRHVMTPADIGAVTQDLLDGSRFNPLFNSGWGAYDPGIPDVPQVIPDTQYFTGPTWIMGLYTSSGGDTIAADPAKRAQLLAQAIPALTLPAGANNTSAFEKRNHNMPVQFVDAAHWPRGKEKVTDVPNWYHSDMCDVAYLYVSKLFDQLVSISNQ